MVHLKRTSPPVQQVEAILMAHDDSAVAARGGWRQIEALPVALFASVMGLTGLSVAWRLAHALYGAPAWLADAIGWIAVGAFVCLAAGYGVKLAIAAEAARAEFNHPIAISLFGTPLISLLLLPIFLSQSALGLARALWVVGAIGMLMLAWLVVTRWTNSRQQVAHATPVWIVPVVGLLDVPLALPSLDLPQFHDIMIVGLAVGLFFAVPLFTIIFARLLFEQPLPDALRPSLLILTAPFSVGFSAYVATTGAIDLFARALYVLTLFMLAVLLPKLAELPRCCPFRVSWWAVSFPLAAAAIAALKVAQAEANVLGDIVALVLLALTTLVIAWLLARTLVGIARGELRTLSS